MEHSSSPSKDLQDIAILQPYLSSILEGEKDGLVHHLNNSNAIKNIYTRGKERIVSSVSHFSNAPLPYSQGS